MINLRRSASVAIAFSFMALPPMVQGQRPGSAEASLNHGIQAFMSEDYVAARRYFESALVHEPDFAAAHYFLGLTFLQSAARETDARAKEALLHRALNEFEQSRLRDPELVLAHLDQGIAQTLLGRFTEAESSLRIFLDKNPNDPLPHLFLAILYYRAGKVDPSYRTKALENLDAAEAAVEQSRPHDLGMKAHVQLYRGLVHIQLKDMQAAEGALSQARDLDPDGEVGRKASDLLDQVRRGELAGRRRWDLSLGTGLEWDSNVPLRGHAPRGYRGDEDDEDWRFGTASAFTYRLVDNEEIVFGVGGSTFNSWHTDIDDFDVQTYGTNVYLGYAPASLPWLGLGIRYDMDYSLVGNDSFLTRHRITPQVDIRESDWARATLFYQLDLRDYRYALTDDFLDRDGITHALGAVQDFDIVEMFDRYLTASVSYRFEDVGTDGTEFDSDNHIFALAVGVPLPRDFTVNVGSEWELQHYQNPSRFDRDRSHRRDVIHTLLLALSKKFDEHLSARFQIEFTDDDSNVRDRLGGEPFSYDRIIYGLSVLYQF